MRTLHRVSEDKKCDADSSAVFGRTIKRKSAQLAYFWTSAIHGKPEIDLASQRLHARRLVDFGETLFLQE